ncbi:MAG: hypothetical protein RLZZ15_2916 [Verrucomicrobiota bacterium]|jgi:pimeloyl-ACP methyl ester carboxylesterase
MPRPLATLPRPLRVALALAALGLAAFAVVSAIFAWRFTGAIRRPLGDAPERFLAAHETVRFPATDGVRLAAWFVPCPDATTAVVLLHGHGGNRASQLARAKFFRDHGYAVLLYDARGHGESAGERVSFGYHEKHDLLGALAWLRGRGFASFGCVGGSQGGATIAFAAAELRDVRWAVLEAVYPTLRNAIDRRFRRTVHVPGWLAGALMTPFAEWRLGLRLDAISPRDAATKFSCPVLVLAGGADEHTHPADARELFDRIPSPKKFHVVPGAKHVDLLGFAKQNYERVVLEFIASAR